MRLDVRYWALLMSDTAAGRQTPHRTLFTGPTRLTRSTLWRTTGAALQIFLLLLGGLAAMAILLVATGHAVLPALAALARGAFGSWYAITSATLVRMIPLGFAGLSVALAFRAGLLNIGAEGQLLMGAVAAAAVMLFLRALDPWIAIPVMLVAGGIAGALWSGAAGYLRLRYGVLEVISTIMLNFVALYVVGWLVRGPLQEPARVNPQSMTLPESLELPVLLSGSRLHAGIIMLVLAALVVWWWLFHTASGFRVRVVGSGPGAAASAGLIPVKKTFRAVFLVGGFLAGLGGAVEYLGVTFALYESFSPGYGYTAIAVALLARNNPLGVLVAALLFGALEAGANAMQRDAEVPSVVVSVVEAVLILLVVAADRWRVSHRDTPDRSSSDTVAGMPGASSGGGSGHTPGATSSNAFHDADQ